MRTEIKEGVFLSPLSEQTKECPVHLPNEILIEIFKKLKQLELFQVSLVCLNWKKFVDELQIKRMNRLVNELKKENEPYFDCYIKSPLMCVSLEKSINVSRETLIIDLVNLKIESSSFKTRKLNKCNDDMARKILSTSRSAFKLVICLKYLSKSISNENLPKIEFIDRTKAFFQNYTDVNRLVVKLCKHLMKKGETSTIFSIINFFVDINKHEALKVYKRIIQKEKNIDVSLRMLSYINNIELQQIIFEYILLNSTQILCNKRFIRIIHERYKDKDVYKKFLEKICLLLVEQNKLGFVQTIVDFYPFNSKNRNHCLAGISRGLFCRKKFSDVLSIVNLIGGPKLKSNILKEFAEFNRRQFFPHQLQVALNDILVILNAIPLESVKETVVRDILEYCKNNICTYETVKFIIVNLNIMLKKTIPSEDYSRKVWDECSNKRELQRILTMNSAIARSRMLLRGEENDYHI